MAEGERGSRRREYLDRSFLQSFIFQFLTLFDLAPYSFQLSCGNKK